MKDYSISEYSFDNQLELSLLKYEKEFLTWPIVYLLRNESTKNVYIGETTDMVSRMKAHLRTPQKQLLNKASLIRSDLFNKSATLDIEANIIRYLAADGKYTLQNGNLGISNHTFYQKKDVYWEVFRGIWEDLQNLGIARHSLDHIDNSDLFKYSPYKSLSREQTSGLKLILECLLDDTHNVSLIHGGAGTGKTILAIFLFKLLKTDISDFNYADFEEQDEVLLELIAQIREKYKDLNIGLVIPMQSFRKTISNVFKNIKGLSARMVIGPSDVAKRKYDLLIVDEGHRLRQWRNLAAYYGTFRKVSQSLGLDELTCSELDWVLKQSEKTVVFYDENQSIKPSDADPQVFVRLQEKPTTRVERLLTQFRVKGGEYYVEFVHQLLIDNTPLPLDKFECIGYEFKLFTDLEQMISVVKKRESEEGLCRLVAGFAWDWISKKDKNRKDIVIGEVELQWNTTDVDWVNSPNAINEVGCIHTTQGYDLNYTGVIIGPELDYDFATKSFVVYKDRYRDKNGKNTISDITVLKNYILNIYRTILFRGIKGTFVYACNPGLRRYLSQYMQLTHSSFTKRELRVFDEPGVNRVRFYEHPELIDRIGLQHGTKINRYIEVGPEIDYPQDYFACRIVESSMDKIVPSDSICLFQKFSGGTPNGLICLIRSHHLKHAQIESKVILREYVKKKSVSQNGDVNTEIILLPRSASDEDHPMVFRDEETRSITIIGMFVKVLE